MSDPILSGSLDPDLDSVPGYSRTSVGPGRSHRPPFLPCSVPPIPCRDGIGMVQLVWP